MNTVIDSVASEKFGLVFAVQTLQWRFHAREYAEAKIETSKDVGVSKKDAQVSLKSRYKLVQVRYPETISRLIQNARPNQCAYTKYVCGIYNIWYGVKA